MTHAKCGKGAMTGAERRERGSGVWRGVSVAAVSSSVTTWTSDAVSRHFFFQAEDGIRGGHVTGVQTCALPISGDGWTLRLRENLPVEGWNEQISLLCGMAAAQLMVRSEERRVGKECRSGWSTER